MVAVDFGAGHSSTTWRFGVPGGSRGLASRLSAEPAKTAKTLTCEDAGIRAPDRGGRADFAETSRRRWTVGPVRTTPGLSGNDARTATVALGFAGSAVFAEGWAFP